MKKIIQVNVVFNRGSTGKIVYDIHQGLVDNNINSIVCFGRGNNNKVNQSIYKVGTEFEAKLSALVTRFTGLQFTSALLSTRKLIKIINNESPDIVHLHCINGYFVNIYKLLLFLKENKIPTVLTLHAEFMFTGSCGHSYECEKWNVGCGSCPQLWEAARSYYFDRTDYAWEKMYNSFKGYNNLIITSVSEWLKNRAESSTILKGHKHVLVNNGIDTNNIFYPRLQNSNNQNNCKIIIHVTAHFSNNISDLKGGYYIISLAKRLINKNFKFIVCSLSSDKISLPENIQHIENVKNQNELAKYYSMADLTIITSKKETFSMVCAESLSCGTPVVGFRAGGPESISLKKYSKFVEYGNIDLLYETVLQWIDKKTNISTDLSSKAKDFYSKEKMVSHYISIYNDLIQIKEE